jgi:hypothetical protein
MKQNLLLLLSLLFVSQSLFSQTAFIRQFPPADNGLKVNELWSLSVSSVSQTPIEAIVKITVTEQSKGNVMNAVSSVVKINQGGRNLQGRFMEPINYDIIDEQVLKSIRRTGTFPDGDYTICVDLVSATTQEVLANSCMEHKVATALAPILFSPYDAADVYDNIIVWSWFMQPEISTGEKVVCDLVVVEILEGQTPEEALKLNPPVIVRPNLTTAQWQTNFATRNLTPGRTYAWKVIAKADGKILNESEIWKFKFNEPEKDDFMKQYVPDNSEKSVDEKAAEDKNKFSLGGKSKITIENSNSQAILSNTPKTYARIEAEPDINVFGVPMGLNFLLTTEENKSNYNMNRAVFGFADTKEDMKFQIGQRVNNMIETLENIKDSAFVSELKELSYADSVAIENRLDALRSLQNGSVESNMETLQMMDLVTPEQEIMSEIPAFGIGKVTPQFSPLFMSSVAVNGGLIEYNPGNFYIGGAIGKLQSNFNLTMLSGNEFINSNLPETPEFYKNLYVGRVGYGKRNGNHAIFSVLYASDDEQSRLVGSLIDSTGNVLRPENNYNIGFSTRFADKDLGITFEGEANASVFNANVNGGTIENPDIPSFFSSIFGSEIKSGTLADFSYSARSIYQMDESGKFQAGIRFVGPGYRSVGVAGLRNDIMQYDIRYDHYLLDRQIKLEAFLSNEQAGYILSDLNNSNMNKLGGRIELRFKNLPVFQINYIGNLQKIKSQLEEESKDNGIHQLMFNASHGFQHKQTRFLSFISYNYQRGTSKDSLADFTTNILMFNQRVSFYQVISIGMMGSYTSTTSLADPNLKPVYTVDLSFVHTPAEWMSNSLGINVNDSETGSIKSFYFSSRLKVIDNIETDLRFDSRTFSNVANPKAGFNETVARLIAIYTL